jgi:hypothetical protein
MILSAAGDAAIGSELLDALREVPVETVQVLAADLPLYSDETDLTILPGVHGIMLEIRGPGGGLTPHVYPTKQIYPQTGRVTSAWRPNGISSPTLYKGPKMGKIVKAFDESMEFAGAVVEVD